jgi:hypothetical protein
MNRPDSWFGSGGKAYQTEAELMGEPTFKSLASRQEWLKDVIQDILCFVLDQAIIAGSLPDKAYEISVNIPPVTEKTSGEIAEFLTKITTALTVAQDKRWIRGETAARIFSAAASQLGTEIDPEEEQAEADQPEITDDYADVPA